MAGPRPPIGPILDLSLYSSWDCVLTPYLISLFAAVPQHTRFLRGAFRSSGLLPIQSAVVSDGFLDNTAARKTKSLAAVLWFGSERHGLSTSYFFHLP